MLGPADIRDWDADERDLPRAAIRSLQWEGRIQFNKLERTLANRLRAFHNGAELTCSELDVLLIDLRRANITRHV